jgi:hypothetical protein
LTAFLAFVGAAVNGTRDVGDVDLPNHRTGVAGGTTAFQTNTKFDSRLHGQESLYWYLVDLASVDCPL